MPAVAEPELPEVIGERVTIAPALVVSHDAPPAPATENASPERIAALADLLAEKMAETTEEIVKINVGTRLLALNAKIEAVRAGAAGAAFGVVAGAIQDLSERTTVAVGRLGTEIKVATGELQRISAVLATQVRGTRLSDLALTNIDLIDRNLYERSCDVRWWATDSSPVNALTERSEKAYQFCSQRFGVILSSYTVYLDLVLCDWSGKVVANGRPDQYRSVGADCHSAAWFKTAQATHSGEEFGFETVHHSPLVGNSRILAYSCCVRENGDVNGKPIGVLGILFNWDALAQTIMHDTPVPADEKAATRACIVDDKGWILADSHDRQLTEYLELDNQSTLFGQKKGFVLNKKPNGKRVCVAHALSPGFETYATGWHSVIVQELAA